MHHFVVGASQDILDLPDPVSFWAVRIMLLLAGVLGGWLAFNTRNAIETMVGLSSRLSPRGKRLSINPERASCIWFYRIDCAIVLGGVIWVFSRHYFSR